MPPSSPCRLEAFLQADDHTESGAVQGPLRIVVRASRECPRVRISLWASDDTTMPTLYEGEVDVDFPSPVDPDPLHPSNDGVATVELPLPGIALSCGTALYLEVRCTDAGADVEECSVAGWRPILCKNVPHPSAPDEPDGRPGEGDDDQTDGWPWPNPPHIQCPHWGRTFVTMLSSALTAIVAGVALANTVVIAGGIALLGTASWLYWNVWRPWCVPHHCQLRGAIVWCLKTAAIFGFGLSLMMTSATAFLISLGYGVAAGLGVAWLKRRRCSVPSSRTPIGQLPLW